jgi:hypothetical protein
MIKVQRSINKCWMCRFNSFITLAFISLVLCFMTWFATYYVVKSDAVIKETPQMAPVKHLRRHK